MDTYRKFLTGLRAESASAGDTGSVLDLDALLGSTASPRRRRRALDRLCDGAWGDSPASVILPMLRDMWGELADGLDSACPECGSHDVEEAAS